MSYESLDDIVEELADKLGVYGAACDDVGLSHEHDDYCCRPAFASRLKERIREAVRVDAAVQVGLMKHVCGLMGYNPTLGDTCERCKADRSALTNRSTDDE